MPVQALPRRRSFRRHSSRPSFIHPDFLLRSRSARRLYHDYAEGLPIIDFHSHLPVSDIAGDTRFENITRLWLKGDHYKWRAMRTNGVNEQLITGDAPDEQKFLAWARTVPFTVRNPLFHWTHLELNFPFGITRLLDESSALDIYKACNRSLQQPEFSAQGILRKFKVEIACTTDDPAEPLPHHAALIKSDHAETRVFPTFRPDRALAIHDLSAFNDWINRLATVSGIEIRTYANLLEALKSRHDFFDSLGCRLSDHALESACASSYRISQVAAAFEQLRQGRAVDAKTELQYKSALMEYFGLLDHAKGWTMQLHLGALRNNNTAMFERLGSDTGFDAIADCPQAHGLARFLDILQRQNALPKTILYNLNPADNEVLATLVGAFQDGSVPGKIQFGSGWWFLDQKDGMEKQMNTLSNLGLLSRFVGMLTDSRCFLSFSRHEYFRRILCNLIGADIEQGELPADFVLLGKLVRSICYDNAQNYFGFAIRTPTHS